MQVDLLCTALGGQFGHGDQVVLVAVHAAVGEQPHEMHGLASGNGFIYCAGQHRILEELAVADRLGHAGEVLVDDTAGAEVHVADLGVAHLAVGQADVHAGAGDQAVRLAGQQAVPIGLLRGIDGVVFRGVAMAEAVQDDQDQGFGRYAHLVTALSGNGSEKDRHFTVWGRRAP
ncbi:hypothetical protein D3C76_971840 [compost metagenome]